MDKRFAVVGLTVFIALAANHSAEAQHYHRHHHHHHHHGHHHHHYGTYGQGYSTGGGYYAHGHYHYCGHGYGYGYGSAWLTPVAQAPVAQSQIAQAPSAGQWANTVNAAPTAVAQPAGAALPAPTFGAYTQVPRVAADLPYYANNLCLTMHKTFQARPDFNATYRQAYALMQKVKTIRDLSASPANREEIARRLPLIDEDMHTVVGGLEAWVNNSAGAPASDIAALKQDVAQLGNALHYLMVDVGVPHRDPAPAPAP